MEGKPRSLSRGTDGVKPASVSASSASASGRSGHPSRPLSTNVTFVVNGTSFIVNRDAVAAHPETMLGKMVSASPTFDIIRQNDRGEFILNSDFSADLFRVALDYFRVGYMTCPAEVPLADLRELCDYLLIPFSAENVKSFDLRALLHEISNDGAKRHFETFLEKNILPSIVQRALKGERECNVVILLDEEQMEWNEKMPPPSGEGQSQVIQSTAMHGFFKYLENRDVAKTVLIERGFKKVCLGIEGFPTHVDRVRPRHDGKMEASYFYVQRPFIRLSWEKEDARSRHVDFQCIRSRSRSAGSLAAAAAEHPLDDIVQIPLEMEAEPEPEVGVLLPEPEVGVALPEGEGGVGHLYVGVLNQVPEGGGNVSSGEEDEHD